MFVSSSLFFLLYLEIDLQNTFASSLIQFKFKFSSFSFASLFAIIYFFVVFNFHFIDSQIKIIQTNKQKNLRQLFFTFEMVRAPVNLPIPTTLILYKLLGDDTKNKNEK